MFGAANNSSLDVDNKQKNILIFGEGPTKGLNHTTIAAKDTYPINFTKSGKRFVQSLH